MPLSLSGTDTSVEWRRLGRVYSWLRAGSAHVLVRVAAGFAHAAELTCCRAARADAAAVAALAAARHRRPPAPHLRLRPAGDHKPSSSFQQSLTNLRYRQVALHTIRLRDSQDGQLHQSCYRASVRTHHLVYRWRRARPLRDGRRPGGSASRTMRPAPTCTGTPRRCCARSATVCPKTVFSAR